MKWGPFVAFMLTIIIISGLVYFSYPLLKSDLENLNSQVQQFNPNNLENLPDSEDISKDIQFIEGIRFDHNNLTYQYAEGCESRKQKMNLAFTILENASNQITFEEITGEADILISCAKNTQNETDNVFLAGEGGPGKIINLTINPLIIQGTIKLYGAEKEETCENPVIEMHELLHVLGYNHINEKNSILYPYYHCDQEIPQNVITHLNKLYSQEPKAEISFKKINATIHGDYLDYDVQIINEGLIKAQKIVLEIRSLSKVITEMELTDIKPGSISTYSVQNQKLTLEDVEEITFEIKTSTNEHSTQNNLEAITF